MVTRIVTNASVRGTFEQDPQRVPGRNITPTPTAASGSALTSNGSDKQCQGRRCRGHRILAVDHRLADRTATMPPKKPVTVQPAAPCARHSWLAPPRLPVISPTRFNVKRFSIRPHRRKDQGEGQNNSQRFPTSAVTIGIWQATARCWQGHRHHIKANR
jgi:hypothetical protein